MKRILLILLFVFYSCAPAFAGDNIYFNFDYAVFKGEDGKSILEVYYSVNQKSLKHVKNGNNFEGNVLIDISITDGSNNNILFSNIYKTPSVLTDTANSNQKLIGQINYLLPKGNYKLKITGSDFNDTTKQDSFEGDLIIDNIEAPGIRISDIELSTMVRKATDDKSIFYKNTLDVIPNPSGLYGMNLNELYYYFEIYGLSAGNISDDFYLSYIITDLNNREIMSHTKKMKRAGDSKADYGKIKIDSLSRGSYVLKVSLTDSLKNVDINNEKKFYVFNNQENVVTQSGQNEFLKSEYITMTEKELDDEFEKMTYILSDKQISKYDDLTSVIDKRKFLYNTWAARDVNQNSQVLEYKVAYLKRINEATRLFQEYFKEGWKTDRGRIFVIYGKPDDIEKYPFNSDKKSYEIWKYDNVEGGGECVFIELQSTTGVYWLVHSTFRSEISNPDWQVQLDPK
ncbi:MAG: GWxTD domain-containing protein [Ignavibacteria bacterium]